MSAQVNKMLGRFQKTGMTFLIESTKALATPTVQYAIGAILVLYITFLESDTESVLSLAMTNPLGRLLILLLLLLLVSVSVPLGILFTILIVMSCSNRENFESVPPNNFTSVSSQWEQDNPIQQTLDALAQEQGGGGGGDETFEEGFLASHGMSPELMEDEVGTVEPATGNRGESSTEENEVEGFHSTPTQSFF